MLTITALAFSRGPMPAVDKDGEKSELARHLPDTDIIISTPFHPAYVTKELIEKVSSPCRHLGPIKSLVA